MTYEEALKEAILRLKNVKIENAFFNTTLIKETTIWLEKVIEALEKQIKIQHHHTAIKEVDGKGVYFRFSICPNCLGEIISYKNGKYPRYCNWCGQAIDWSDFEIEHLKGER